MNHFYFYCNYLFLVWCASVRPNLSNKPRLKFRKNKMKNMENQSKCDRKKGYRATLFDSVYDNDKSCDISFKLQKMRKCNRFYFKHI